MGKVYYLIPFIFTNDINHEIKLLKLINKIGAPLYTYEKIMHWANEFYLAGYKKKYQSTIDCLEEHYKFSICRPVNVPVSLYGDNAEINVVVFDVKKMIASLFDDPAIN